MRKERIATICETTWTTSEKGAKAKKYCPGDKQGGKKRLTTTSANPWITSEPSDTPRTNGVF